MISLDSETTGVDLRHAARPFLVTVCRQGANPTFWEWDVDPITRRPDIPETDAREIRHLLAVQDGGIVLHNAKFDAAALLAGEIADWEPLWPLTHDTLMAGHLLASNHPHNLTDMVMFWLGWNIQPFEDRLGEACKKARALVRSHKLGWLIAEEGIPGFPSIKGAAKGEKDRVWKNDSWLPRTVCRLFGYAADHPWWTVTSDYACMDSKATVELHGVVQAEIARRNLGAIYAERMRLLPIATRMEARGVTVHVPSLANLEDAYRAESAACAETCSAVAAEYDYPLELPKSGMNNSLKHFCFGEPVYPDGAPRKPEFVLRTVPYLDLPVVAWTDGGSPSLDSKNAIPEYLATLGGDQLRFVRALARKRKRDTFLTYLAGYRRFGVAGLVPDYLNLHPSLNPTGTDTLRWSSSNPNSQNISKQEIECESCRGEGCPDCNHSGYDFLSLRRTFAPLPDREWWSLDAKNIELRLPAYLSGEKELIDLFERPDEPPYYGSTHLLNFHTVYPDVWERELGKTCNLGCCKGKTVTAATVGPHCKKKYAAAEYQWDKNGGFCKQYGGGRYLTDKTFRRPGASDLLDARFSRLAGLNAECIAYANKYGYVETIPDRTVDPHRGYPLLCGRTDRGGVLETLPLNYKIQGSAMQWTAKAMRRTDDELERWRKKAFDAYLMLQVHDELVFDLPRRADPRTDPKRSNLPRVRELARLMALGGDDFVTRIPTPVGVEFHPDSWGEGVTFNA